MSRVTILGVVLAVVMVFTGHAIADETVHSMSLQGQVADETGQPLATGNLGVRIFNVIVDGTAGNLVYDSANDFNNAIQNGIFDVVLGSSTKQLNLDNTIKYYMEVDINGEEVVGDATPAGRQAFWPGSGDHTHTHDDLYLTEAECNTNFVNTDEAGSVNSNMIANNGVTAEDLAGNSVNSAAIANGSIVAEDIFRTDCSNICNDATSSTDCAACDSRFVNEGDLDHLDASDGSPLNAVSVDANGDFFLGTPSKRISLRTTGLSNDLDSRGYDLYFNRYVGDDQHTVAIMRGDRSTSFYGKVDVTDAYDPARMISFRTNDEIGNDIDSKEEDLYFNIWDGTTHNTVAVMKGDKSTSFYGNVDVTNNAYPVENGISLRITGGANDIDSKEADLYFSRWDGTIQTRMAVLSPSGLTVDGGVVVGRNNRQSEGLLADGTIAGVIGRGDDFGVGGRGGTAGVQAYGDDCDFVAMGPGQNMCDISSIRWKRNIKEIDCALDKVENLQGVYFDWDEEHGGQHDMGMIAEEVGKIVPEIVVYEKDGVNAMGMNYAALTPLLVEAIKELKQQNDQLKELVCLDHPDAEVCAQ